MLQSRYLPIPRYPIFEEQNIADNVCCTLLLIENSASCKFVVMQSEYVSLRYDL